jgi:hypothetical protein
MKADMELALVHDGKQWVAHNPTLLAKGETFAELDANLTAILRQSGQFSSSRVTVFMGFDFSSIPTWLRQYSYHYFNRYVSLEL